MIHPRSLLLATAATLLLAATAPAQIIFDDFNDGNDTGWTRNSPLAPVAAGVFTFPGGNTYQIHAPASPSPGTVGPARAGSLRTDANYSAFTLQVDIVDWDETKTGMAMGLLARLSNVAPGDTDGYAFTLDGDGDLAISRVTNEQPTTIGLPFDLGSIDPNHDFRLVFSGLGTIFNAQLFNLTTGAPPVTLNATDATYASGTSGLIVFDATLSTTATAVFDNFQGVPEPGTGLLAIAGLGLVGLIRRRQ